MADSPDYLRAAGEPYVYPFPDEIMSVEGDMGDALVDALIPALTAATSTPERCHYALWEGWGDFHAQTIVWAQDSSGPQIEAAEIVNRLRLADAVAHAFVESCPVQPWWGGRDMRLFDGPIDAVAAIGSTPFGDELRRRGPQWWWPEDRSWFVATEIDYPWTYLAGSVALVDAITGDPRVEAVRIDGTANW